MLIKRGFISLILILFLILLFCSCNERIKKSDDPDILPVNPEPALLDFPLEKQYYQLRNVVDGDTIRLEGIKPAIRLLCVDTEEVFKPKDAEDRDLAKEDWDAYIEMKSASESYKYPTLWGEQASNYAEVFFSKVENISIEYDSIYRKTGFFDRPLCYVFGVSDGVAEFFNVELVRWGYSPYFAKYGYSEKYHDDFVEAEKEARKKNRGIWNSATECYPDYDQRIERWNRLGDQIRHFKETYFNTENYFHIQNEIHWSMLDDYTGMEITLFGTIDTIRKTGPPYRVLMNHKRGQSVLLVTDVQDIYDALVDAHIDEYYIYCAGILDQNEKGFNMNLVEIEKVYSANRYLEPVSTDK